MKEKKKGFFLKFHLFKDISFHKSELYDKAQKYGKSYSVVSTILILFYMSKNELKWCLGNCTICVLSGSKYQALFGLNNTSF